MTGSHTSESPDSASPAAHTAPRDSSRTGVWDILVRAAYQFMEDRAFILGGALAFFSALSFGPVLIMMLWVAGSIDATLQDAIVGQVRRFLGAGGGRVVELVLANARERPELGNLAGTISLVVLLFSATAAFAHLQTAMNLVWNVPSSTGREIRDWFWKRLLSLGMMVGIGIFLFLAILASAVITFVSGTARELLPGTAALWRLSNAGLTITLFSVLFAALFKFLPDARIAWRDAWFGGAVTGTLVWAGKELIGLYLGQSSVGSAYGAAGALLVFLVWVYYSALLVFYGAELTQVWAHHHGRGITSDHARTDAVSGG